MRTAFFSSLAGMVALGGGVLCLGCGGGSSYVHAQDATLGRVVVYRNGVAYFERYAQIQGNSLKLAVPGDKVDDFLKSLTVVDAKTGEAAPVTYPSGTNGDGFLDMKVHLPEGHHTLKLSYVTEAPSWKPSYRVTLAEKGTDKGKTVDLQGWAVVDNTSGEDWSNVKLGVGSSSAMSFRFDLRSLRTVQRETLQTNDLFAIAPPTGAVAYGGAGQGNAAGQPRSVYEFADSTLAAAEARFEKGTQLMAAEEARRPGSVSVDTVARGRAAAGAATRATAAASPTAQPVAPPPPVASQMAATQLASVAAQVNAQLARGTQQVVVEGYAARDDADKQGASTVRANRLREQLIRNGVDGSRLVAVGRGEQTGKDGGARVVDAPTVAAGDGAANHTNLEPIGTSHFESGVPMTVARGSAAMVSILHAPTEGEVVYLFDPESPRGNTQFPFKSVRLKNPTDSALESGPVTVFGDGRFIGEGLAEPIPGRATAFVPFALDRQVLVERKDGEHDAIAKIVKVERGVFTTEVRHTRKATFALYNRGREPVAVFVKHTVPAGYALSKAPPVAEKIGGADLFRVDVPAGGHTELVLEEATPVSRTCDIRTVPGMDLVRAYLSSAAATGPLKDQVTALLQAHQEMARLDQQITGTREQMNDYRGRMDELHAQLVTLKAVKTAGPLMGHLAKKLQEVSDALSKATMDVVTLQEKLTVARIRFQDGVADLSLEQEGTKVADKGGTAGPVQAKRSPDGT